MGKSTSSLLLKKFSLYKKDGEDKTKNERRNEKGERTITYKPHMSPSITNFQPKIKRIETLTNKEAKTYRKGSQGLQSKTIYEEGR